MTSAARLITSNFELIYLASVGDVNNKIIIGSPVLPIDPALLT